jgi:hypothetical protein
MSRKLSIALPIAILLGAVSAVPALAQGGNQHASAYAHRLLNNVRAERAYALAPSTAQSSAGCPTLEGYPDCHPGGRTPWTIYPGN